MSSEEKVGLHEEGEWNLKEGDGTTIEMKVMEGKWELTYVVAKTWTSPFAPSRSVAAENARRIVLCVNACRGLTEGEVKSLTQLSLSRTSKK